MPKWFKAYLESLTDAQADELAQWYDGVGPGSMEVLDTLLMPRPALHKDWNINQ